VAKGRYINFLNNNNNNNNNDVIRRVSCVVERFWLHGEGWCPTLELVGCVTFLASASQPLGVAAPVSASSCIDEFHRRRNHDSAETEKTSSSRQHVLLQKFIEDLITQLITKKFLTTNNCYIC